MHIAFSRFSVFYSPLIATFAGALDVFQHAGLISTRHAYEKVVVAPPV